MNFLQYINKRVLCWDVSRKIQRSGDSETIVCELHSNVRRGVFDTLTAKASETSGASIQFDCWPLRYDRNLLFSCI